MKYLVPYFEDLGIFLCVPKVANTSVKIALCDWKGIAYPDSETVHKVIPRIDMMHIDQYDCPKYGFVRDPWSRMVSCYRNKISPRYHARVMRKFLGPSSTFEQFIRFVEDNPERNNHWIPCSFYYQYADTVIRFEDINTWWSNTFPDAPELGSYNGSGSYNWRDYYDRELFERVAELFPHDVNMYKEISYEMETGSNK